MTNLLIKDGGAVNKYFEKRGLGTTADPFTESIDRFSNIDSTLNLSQAITIADYKQLSEKDDVLFDTETSGGTETTAYSAVNSGVDMVVALNGEYVIRQTKVSHSYTAGNPQRIEMTTNDLTPVTNIVKRMGAYCSSITAPYTANLDGFCVETDNTAIYFKIYKNGTTSFSAVQSTWDDPMDGSGRSGIAINNTKFQALVIDYLYLGGTCARFGFIIGEEVVWCHTFKNSNVNSTSFVTSPNQPLRWEIRSTGGADSFFHICGKVATVGALETNGITRSYNMDASFSNANSTANKYALLGIRSTNRIADIQVTNISGLALTTDAFLLELVINPTVAGTFTYSAVTNTPYELATGDTAGSPSTNTITNGTLIASKYVSSASSASIEVNNMLRIGTSIAGVQDTIVLCVQPMSANLDVLGSIDVTVHA